MLANSSTFPKSPKHACACAGWLGPEGATSPEKGPLMWEFITLAKAAMESIFRMEKQMGLTADALAGMAEQLDKVTAEVEAAAANAQKLDQADLDAIAAVKGKIQAMDERNPDVAATPPAV